MKNIGWIVLYTQLLIGLIYSYSYFHRHLIVNKVLLFCVAVVGLSNLLFFLFSKIKYFSIRSFLSIIISSVVLTVLFTILNRDSVQFEAIDLVLISLYLVLRLLLFITTPIAMLIEAYLRYRK
ncbi:hypothetical protein AMD27_03865 [Acinetobacter sp. TGL-Y2]|nr:hypothetical protein AMD27_03865 [Acinetobacter sp. TGL-Y2]